MIKRILIYFLIAGMLFSLSFSINSYLLKEFNVVSSFSLFSVYLFHVIASLIVYGMIELAAKYMPDQAGFAYLIGVFVKMGFFMILFGSVVFGELELQKIERLSLIVPLFLYLITEAIASAKLLNKSQISP